MVKVRDGFGLRGGLVDVSESTETGGGADGARVINGKVDGFAFVDGRGG